MRRRPMQAWPKRDRVPLGPRGKRVWSVVALAVVAFFVATTSGSATTLPSASYTISGVTGDNGWYRGSAAGDFVVVHWTLSDPDNLVVNSHDCGIAVQVPGPTTGTQAVCTVDLAGGGSIPFPTSTIKIDADPPTSVAATPARAPDANGWYNHAVSLAWNGSDTTSGIASCTSTSYAGPDSATASVSGSCRDKAGNVGSGHFVLRYDATPPTLSKVKITSRAASDLVRWTSTSSSDTAVVQRWARGNSQEPVVFRGAASKYVDKKIQVGLEYAYAIQTVDQAGNLSKRITVSALPKVLTLRKTSYIPRAARNPILRWPKIRRARYYHVQLFRGSKRILAVWPNRRQLALPRAWKWAGRRYRLKPGQYRWYVWAGIGRRSFARYNRIGSARFIVRPG
jgi:hypothetical protein